MKSITYQPIGIIHTPFNEKSNTPIQPASAIGVEGKIEVFSEFADGLKDIDGFSHLIIVYHFHLSEGFNLEVKPFLDEETHGVFATRAPKRPNGIGISVVKLKKAEGSTLHIENVDVINETPLLDIKPFVPDFSINDDVKIGWLSKHKDKIPNMKADNRFG